VSIVAIIQARMGSTRLPNKMLLHLHGYPIVEWVYRRVRQSTKVDTILFALPDARRDDILAWYLESIDASVYRGSETDLIERFYHAAKSVSAKEIVRVCADNPLICASEIDRLIEFYHDNPCDIAYNNISRSNKYPTGIGAGICSMDLLEELHVKATSAEHREHLFNYAWDHQTNYRIATFNPPEKIAHPELKLIIDTDKDYLALLEKHYRIGMSTEEIIAVALQ